MIITAPITDYIPASILTTLGDLVLRGAADPDRLAASVNNYYLKSQGVGALPIWEDLRISDNIPMFVTGTRNANGVQTVTGFTMTPVFLIAIAADGTPGNKNFSVGFFKPGGQGRCLYHYDNGIATDIDSTVGIRIRRAAGNQISCTPQAIRPDEIDLNWTLVGACVADFILISFP